MKIFVTGATGVIGRHVVPQLIPGRASGDRPLRAQTRRRRFFASSEQPRFGSICLTQ